MRRALLVLLLTAWLTQAAPAGARVVTTLEPSSGATLIQGPSLAEGVLTWMTGEGMRRHRVHARYPGGRRAVLATIGPGSGPSSFDYSMYFFASDTHLALARSWFVSGGEDDYDSGGLRLHAGAFGAKPAQLARCQVDFFQGWVRPALSGARIAYDATPCRRADSMLAVRELDSGETWRSAYPGQKIRLLDADGRFLAIATEAPGAGPRIAVLDLGTGTSRYRIDIPRQPSGAWTIASLDVAPDGSLAVMTDTTRSPCDSELTRYSSTGEVHDRRVACELVAHLTGRTVFVTRHDAGRAIAAVGTGTGVPRTVVELDAVPLRGADAGGGRLAWAVPTCSGGDALHLRRLEASDAGVLSSYCPGGLSTRRLVVRPSGRSQLVLRCPTGCSGWLTLSVGGRTIAYRYYSIPNGRTPVDVWIGPWARRRLASGPLRARAKLVVRHLDGTRHVERPMLLLTRR